MKRRSASFLIRFSATVAASFLVRLAAIYPITLWAIGAIAILFAVQIALLARKWAIYYAQANTPNYFLGITTDAIYGDKNRIDVGELVEESTSIAVWAAAALVGGGTALWHVM